MSDSGTSGAGQCDGPDRHARFVLNRTFATNGVILPDGAPQHLELDLGTNRAARIQLLPDLPDGLWSSSNSGDAVLGEGYSSSLGPMSSVELPHKGPFTVVDTELMRSVPDVAPERESELGIPAPPPTDALEDDAYTELVMQSGHVEGLLAIGFGPQLVWKQLEERFAVGWEGEWSVRYNLAPMAVMNPIKPDLSSLLGNGVSKGPPPAYSLAMHWWMKGKRESQEVDQYLAYWTAIELFLGVAAPSPGSARLYEKFDSVAKALALPGWEADIEVFRECRMSRNKLVHEGDQRPFLGERANQLVALLQGLLWKYLRPSALGRLHDRGAT